MKKSLSLFLAINVAGCLFSPCVSNAKEPVKAYDMAMAKEICASLPMDNVEGVWLYPEDKVTVLILKEEDTDSNRLPCYSISVVDTSDSRLRPGETLGKLEATPDNHVYKIELATERKNNLLLKSKSCLANLSNDGETFFIKRQKSPFKGRLNLNLSRLLPGFWKMVSTGISTSGQDEKTKTPVGMIKIYPSYDGNGSSKRQPRYL